MKYPNLLKASGTEEILAVIENLPVNANGFFLTEAQMDGIEAAIKAADTTATELGEALATANTNCHEAEASLSTANETIATRDARITELEGELATLKAGPAGEMKGTAKEQDESLEATTEASYASDDNPFNQFVDKAMGKSKK